MNTRGRTVRPTFLLRVLILAAFIALFGLLFVFARAQYGALGQLIVLAAAAVVWFLGIEGGLLPYLAERWLARRASTQDQPPNSLFFADVDAEQREEQSQAETRGKDNPTLR